MNNAPFYETRKVQNVTMLNNIGAFSRVLGKMRTDAHCGYIENNRRKISLCCEPEFLTRSVSAIKKQSRNHSSSFQINKQNSGQIDEWNKILPNNASCPAYGTSSWHVHAKVVSVVLTDHFDADVTVIKTIQLKEVVYSCLIQEQ